MITIGVDAHKRVHVALAVDDGGRELGHWRGPNTLAGWQEVLIWAEAFGAPRRWGVEGAWSYGRSLAQHLVGHGETVFEINTRWTALGRRGARKPGKTDRLDARSVALFVRQEAPALPAVNPDDETAVLDLFASQREDVLAESVRIRNQLHALLSHVDPEYDRRLPNLRSKSCVAALEVYATDDEREIQQQRAACIRRLAARLKLTLEQVDLLSDEIERRAVPFSPLTQICGINLLTAGILAGILGPGSRFSTDAQLAAYAGAAPLEASSAAYVRHRLSRGGNRRLNSILYRIALTQAHYSPNARAYICRRVAEGKSPREAKRALKRFIVRAIWRAWQECLAQSLPSTVPTAA
jgi:transposase